MAQQPFDVAIVGAGPAGAATAILLTHRGRRVALIDRDPFPRSRTSAGWLNARAAPLLAELGVPVKPLLDHAFREVTFHSADFEKTARPSFADAPGYLVDRAEFDNSLVATAERAKVHLLAGTAIADVRVRENSVTLTSDSGGVIETKLLVIAAGAATRLTEAAGITRPAAVRPIWTAQLNASVTPRGKSEPRVAVVLGLDKRGSFGLCCAARANHSISLVWMGERKDAGAALATLAAGVFKHGLIGTDLSAAASNAEVARGPSATALEMESHVGKHTIVIGDAGGFVSAASHEGIYPAMWSGQIAAQVLDAALGSRHSQDELMTFNTEWRMKMADYLRSPNTDIQYLLPLIFSNQPMADRMGAAFFSGENI